MRRPNLSVMVVAAAAVVLSGCASTGTGETTRRSSTQIMAEEIDSVHAIDMFEVIERLRPRWLIARAARSFGSETGVLVYQEQTLLGGVEMLRQIKPDMVERARYLDGQTAATTLPGIGTGHVAGAIVITPRTGGPR
jgi:hypothetical protein